MEETLTPYLTLTPSLLIFILYTGGGTILWMTVFAGNAIFHKKPGFPRTANGRECCPGVSIIKPLCGINRLLEECLESYFTLKYPKFELLFCVQDDDDPVFNILDKLCKKYPNVDVRCFTGGKPGIINPMVGNMVPGYEQSKYDLVWICSARVKVNSDIIYDLVEKARHPKVAIVHQMPYVSDQQSLGNIVEQLAFGGAVAKLYITANVLGFCCLCGMSYLIKKPLLEEVNGLVYYGKYLSEDQFLAEALHSKGYQLRLSAFPALQYVERNRNSLMEHKDRMVRWYRLRITMMPMNALVWENFYDCFPNGLLGSWSIYTLFGIDPYVVFILHVTFWIIREYALLRMVQNGPLKCPLPTLLCLWVFRESLGLYVLMEAILSPGTIRWGNKIFRLKSDGLAVLQEGTSPES